MLVKKLFHWSLVLLPLLVLSNTLSAGTALAPVLSTVGSRASSGEGTQGGRGVSTGLVDPAIIYAQPSRNIGATVLTGPAPVATSNAADPGVVASVSQPVSESGELSSMTSYINAQLRDFVSHEQRENRGQSGRQQYYLHINLFTVQVWHET